MCVCVCVSECVSECVCECVCDTGVSRCLLLMCVVVHVCVLYFGIIHACACACIPKATSQVISKVNPSIIVYNIHAKVNVLVLVHVLRSSHAQYCTTYRACTCTF